MTPPRLRRPRPNSTLRRRLAFTESELDAMRRLCGLFATDLTVLRGQVPDLDERLCVVAGVVGALLAVAGVDPPLVAAWLAQLGPAGLPEEAQALAEEVIDALLLMHMGSAGEA